MRVVVRLLLLVLLLVLVLGLVAWYLPAGFAWRQFGHHMGPALQLEQLSGTVRKGRAGDMRVNGFPVGALDWQVDWRGLFRRELGASWSLEGPAWRASARSTRMPDGSLHVQDMRMSLPAILLGPVLDIPALGFIGTVEVELDQARLAGLAIHEARGRARWVEAGVTGQAQARFGPLRATFATQAPGLVIGEVEDEGGPLEVDGQFELHETRYRAEVILRARDPAHPVAQALPYVGQPLPDGSALFIVEGELRRRAGDGEDSSGR